MPTYKQCLPTNDGAELLKMAKAIVSILNTLGPEHEFLDKVKVDYVFAYADLGEDGEPTNDAITHNGRRAYGLCKIVNLKDRAKGNGDAEILIDHDYWKNIPEEQQRALLDHELTHIQVCLGKNGDMKLDDLSRPKLAIRKHDIEVGWFSAVAKRHGAASIERIQAAEILEMKGQLLWPQLVGSINVTQPVSKQLKVVAEMSGSSTPTINIDMNKKCSKCGKPGATDSGLCLSCVSKRITTELRA